MAPWSVSRRNAGNPDRQQQATERHAQPGRPAGHEENDGNAEAQCDQQQRGYREELARWRGRFDVRLEAIVDRAGRDWYGPVGVVTRLLDAVAVEPDDAAFVCGPEIMMRFAARELVQRGLTRAAIWLSIERSMKCGVGLCGHCQLGGTFACKDGPVYRLDRLAPLLQVREL